MTEEIQEFRERAGAHAAELLGSLTELDPTEVPDSFAVEVGDLCGMEARLNGIRVSLETLELQLEKSREFDAQIQQMGAENRSNYEIYLRNLRSNPSFTFSLTLAPAP